MIDNQKKNIPIFIKRRSSDIQEKFMDLIKRVDFNEFDDEDDFHIYMIHELTELFSENLESYNNFYEYLDDIMIGPIKKVWKNRKKIIQVK